MNLWRDLGTNRLSWRHFGVLVKYLPPESFMFQKVHPEPVWGVTEHLLADLVDAENLALWQRSGGGTSKKPKPIPRPGTAAADAARRTDLSNDELAARLRAQKARTET